MSKSEVTVQVKMEGIDLALEKITLLAEKMQEVKSLADELTSCIADLNLEVKF